MAHSCPDGPGKSDWATYETVFTNSKAGMECVDKDKVKKVVYEMSKDSAHFRNEQRKQASVDERICRLKEKAAKLTKTELEAHERSVEDDLAALEATRDLSKVWLHVDMDAFYASVEELDDPSLKEKPMAVGGKSMISTANYVARKYGVRSAMPGFIALKLCPQLVFVKPDFQKYQKLSKATREVIMVYDPDFDAGSLDEAHLDVTEYCKEHAVTGAQVAETLREQVFARTGLTCSVGIAPNRMLAKVSSDINKPNGQYMVEANQKCILDFIRTLPVRKVPGIGKVTGQVLTAFDIHVCGDLYNKRGLVSALFSPCSRSFFLEVSLGLGSTNHWEAPAEGEVGRKGIGCERTFHAISSREDLENKASELAKHLSDDMVKKSLKGKTVTLKLKLTTFEVRTRASTLPHYVSSSDEILKPMLKLLSAELPLEIRLMGVRVSNFWEDKREPGQPSLMQFVQKGQAEAAQGENSAACKVDRVPYCISPPEQTPQVDYVVPESHCNLLKNPSQTLDPSGIDCVKDRLTGAASPSGVHGHEQNTVVQETTLNVWKCGVCGEVLDSSLRQEHEDFHVALAIEKEDRRIHKVMNDGIGWRSSGSQKQRGTKRRKSSLGSLDNFLVKKQ